MRRWTDWPVKVVRTPVDITELGNQLQQDEIVSWKLIDRGWIWGNGRTKLLATGNR
jgi:hypothetical protein